MGKIYINKKGELVQQNTFSPSEEKYVDCNLIYINSDLFMSTKKRELVQESEMCRL